MHSCNVAAAAVLMRCGSSMSLAIMQFWFAADRARPHLLLDQLWSVSSAHSSLLLSAVVLHLRCPLSAVPTRMLGGLNSEQAHVVISQTQAAACWQGLARQGFAGPLIELASQMNLCADACGQHLTYASCMLQVLCLGAALGQALAVSQLSHALLAADGGVRAAAHGVLGGRQRRPLLAAG